MLKKAVADLYDAVLATGDAGRQAFYAALRGRGIDPVPNPATGSQNLYNPLPVIVDSMLVAQMATDVDRFCEALCRMAPDGEALLARMPPELHGTFASVEIAGRIAADLRNTRPLVGVDAFLEATPHGLAPAYLEWQTVGMYLTIGRWFMECMATTWPVLQIHSTLTASPDLTLDELGRQVRALYLSGIEDDPRQGVVLDYQPLQQPTRDEFLAIRELTGGARMGMGIIDPRELLIHAGRPHYRRDGELMPVRRVYSRLVYSDMLRLQAEATPVELATLRRLYAAGDDLSWISHPLHFFYGSKADFPRFWQLGLSTALKECWSVDDQFIRTTARELATGDRLVGYVQKPITLQSGRGVIRHPALSELRPGSILQREIDAAACHPTPWGGRTPEIRVMCFPSGDGSLRAGLVYTRVKAPEAFLSNAGQLAALGIAGTGEGYGVVVTR